MNSSQVSIKNRELGTIENWSSGQQLACTVSRIWVSLQYIGEADPTKGIIGNNHRQHWRINSTSIAL